MFLPPGVLHAYLEGTGTEIMANSNNVLRGGLTPKHVDVPELLANVVFEGGSAEVLQGEPIEGSREWIYRTPAQEFELRKIEVTPDHPYQSGSHHGAEILILIESKPNSEATVFAGTNRLKLKEGEVFLVPHGLDYTMQSGDDATFFKATVPESTPRFRGRQPTVLRFGTSGLRGLVTDITDLEAYINTCGFLEYLSQRGGARPGDTVSIAGDLRPSTDRIMEAVAKAIQDSGLEVENLGRIPTPALTYYAVRAGQSSVMVTGSHIPFDRNGIKFNKSTGEVLKEDEPAILEAVAEVRRREYGRPADQSLFDDSGMFSKGKETSIPSVDEGARQAYIQRYLDFFPSRGLAGKRVVFFQHSAVGRDLLVEVLSELGAEVHPAGRSDSFIAIDTEDITDQHLRDLQEMIDEVSRRSGPVDALVSTDGDSDRPLLVGVDSKGKARFFGGDLLGIVVAEYLGADCVTVPISANDAVDHQLAKRGIKAAKTGIGSPYVIKVMQESSSAGKRRVAVGWEANGGFLTGSLIEKEGRKLAALPTRDAALPLITALYASQENDCSIVELFSQLPPRFSKAGLLDQFPRELGHALIRRFSPEDPRVLQVDFKGEEISLTYEDGSQSPASKGESEKQLGIRGELSEYFSSRLGFDEIIRLNRIDGLRIYFANGDIAHIRPSGNAPQLRIYAVAHTQERADEIVKMGIREPDGLLRMLEAACKKGG
jgi:phosphomannomutase